jgi:hypothetical protein
MLIINESSVGAFLVTALYLISPCYYFTYHLFLALAEYQPQVYSTLLFLPTTQTCFSEGEDGLKFFDAEF